MIKDVFGSHHFEYKNLGGWKNYKKIFYFNEG